MKTLGELSKELKISRKTLWSAMQDKRIPGIKMGRDWFIYDTHPKFEEFLKAYKPKEEKK
jgi:hypothetical protein